MADCPNKECHDNLTEVREAVFGKGGLRECVGNKVSKTAMWAAVVVIGIPLFLTGVKVWSGHEASALRFAAAQEVAVLRERMSNHEVQFKALCDTLYDIKITLVEVRKDIKSLDHPNKRGN